MDFAACVDKVGYGLSGVGRVQLHLTLYLVISQTQRHNIDRLASPLGFQLKCKLCHGNIMWWQSKSFPIPNLPQLMKMVSIGRRRYKPQQIIFVMREYHWNLSVFLLFTNFEYSGLYAATIDWQMIQRYPRHLSFYSAPSCLRVFPFLAVWTYTTVHSLECLVYFCKLASFLHCCLVVMSD